MRSKLCVLLSVFILCNSIGLTATQEGDKADFIKVNNE